MLTVVSSQVDSVEESERGRSVFDKGGVVGDGGKYKSQEGSSHEQRRRERKKSCSCSSRLTSKES